MATLDNFWAMMFEKQKGPFKLDHILWLYTLLNRRMMPSQTVCSERYCSEIAGPRKSVWQFFDGQNTQKTSRKHNKGFISHTKRDTTRSTKFVRKENFEGRRKNHDPPPTAAERSPQIAHRARWCERAQS